MGLYCEQFAAPSSDPGSSSLDTPAKAPAKATPKATPNVKRPASDTGSAPHDDVREKVAKKAKLDLIRKASTTKNNYLTLKAVQAQILSNICSDASYSWANNEETPKRLSAVEAEVTEFIGGYSFNKFTLVHDPAEVKTVYGDEIALSSRLNLFLYRVGAGLGQAFERAPEV